MGCGTSKPKKRCQHCKNQLSPVTRSYTIHVHPPPQTKGDSYHVVALTSTSLGSLYIDASILDNPLLDNNKVLKKIKLDDLDLDSDNENEIEHVKGKKKEFSKGSSEAKTCSRPIEERIPITIPQTPVTTPPGEPETINAWELMAGLEDTTPFLSPAQFGSPAFDVWPIHDDHDPNGQVKPRLPVQETEAPTTKSIWLQMAEDQFFSTEFDPEIISEFREAVAELSPDNNNNQPFDSERQHVDGNDRSFYVHNDNKVNGDNWDFKCKNPDKLVLYFTSLRGVRKTYEVCCYVRVILKGLGVRVDERDVSMDSGFKEELRELLGDSFNVGALLPKLFLGSKCIGGAEEIRQMHEDGYLEKLLDGCEKVGDGVGGSGPGVCDTCGDIRFIPCETCSGSCKVFYECDEYGAEEEEEFEEDEFGFQRCPDCNENGLIRCPVCCY